MVKGHLAKIRKLSESQMGADYGISRMEGPKLSTDIMRTHLTGSRTPNAAYCQYQDLRMNKMGGGKAFGLPQNSAFRLRTSALSLPRPSILGGGPP